MRAMISQNELQGIVEEFLQSSDGKAYLVDNAVNLSGYTEEEMKHMAEELRDRIVDAYLGIVADPAAYFDISGIRINSPRQGETRWKLNITFSAKSLHRYSLSTNWNDKGVHQKFDKWGDEGNYTGKGVYDIFGLLTQGYSTKPVYGFWADQGGEESSAHGLIRSLPFRAANDFISRTIIQFKNDYPTIGVRYPALWGGTSGSV